MKLTLTTVVLAAALALPAAAHHSVPVNFDMDDIISVRGTITETTWVNPHSRLVLNVAKESGDSENWLVEMNAVNTMQRKHFPFDEFEVGDEVEIIGFRGKHDRSIYFQRALLDSGIEVIWTSSLEITEQKIVP